MANVDTGLGWSAEGSYLMLGSGKICDLGGTTNPTIPDQPTYNGSTVPAMIVANGVKYAQGRWDSNRQWFFGADPGIEIFAMASPSTGGEVWFISPTPNVTVHLVYYNAGSGEVQSTAEVTIGTTVYSNSPRLYYTWTRYASDVSIVVPTRDFNFVSNIYATYYKLNTNPAVVLMSQWTTLDGVQQKSPVLISTDESAVKLSIDGTNPDPSAYHTRVRYDGLTFYMCYYLNNTTLGSFINYTQPNIDFDALFIRVLTPTQYMAVVGRPEFANILALETEDPYEDFGYTEEDIGDIDPDPQDDDIEIDDLPDKSFATAGFCRIFNPDVSDLNDLASYMWTDQTFLQTVINHLKQLLENPMDAIISLSLVPVQPPTTSNKVPVNVMFVSTGVSMRQVTNQFVSVDCGTTVLRESLGGALDYNPYTRVQIYLPYVGTVQLDTDEVMNKTIHVVYHIDVVTGICCAEIEADNKLLYQFTGHCSVSQPITSADFSSYLNAAIAAAKVAVGVATGTAATTAAAAASEGPAIPASSPTGNSSQALVPAASGQAIGPHLGSPPSRHQLSIPDIPYSAGDSKPAMWGELSKPGNVNTVAAAMGGKMVVQHSGGFSGNSGYLAKRRPYLIVIRPRIANPREYSQHFGRTSMEYLNLGACTGYTKVESVHLTGFDATNPELSEISSLLKGGVIF